MGTDMRVDMRIGGDEETDMRRVQVEMRRQT